MKKFTFKSIRNEGRYKAFQSENVDIKLAKKKVGLISEASHLAKNIKDDERYSISFMVTDTVASCGWKWIRLTKRFSNSTDAKEWLSKEAVYEGIQKKYELYSNYED